MCTATKHTSVQAGRKHCLGDSCHTPAVPRNFAFSANGCPNDLRQHYVAVSKSPRCTPCPVHARYSHMPGPLHYCTFEFTYDHSSCSALGHLHSLTGACVTDPGDMFHAHCNHSPCLLQCQKLGPLDKITVYSRNPLGPVVVKFGTAFAAEECIKSMDGRWFGQRRWVASCVQLVVKRLHAPLP